jgi:orotate phosphoribosyltransferase
MNQHDVLKEFEAAGAILKGHFILSSGLRSDTYMQCARVLTDAARAERLCSALAAKVRERFGDGIDCVISPAMGGILVGYEVARHLRLPTMFCERVDGAFALRRGFQLEEGARVLVVEDVVTTGKSSREAFACIRANGGEVIGEAALIDRSAGCAELGVPLVTLAAIDVRTYEPDQLPSELAAIPPVKPGSRDLRK